MNAPTKSRKQQLGLIARVSPWVFLLGSWVVSGTGCNEYSMLYGSHGGGGWYDYSVDYSDGTSAYSMNPYTDVGAELDNYLSDSWTTSY